MAQDSHHLPRQCEIGLTVVVVLAFAPQFIRADSGRIPLDDLPTLRVVRLQPERMEPGVTLFSLFRWDNDAASKTYGAFVAVDETGNIIWHYRCEGPAAAIRRLANGNLMFIHGTEPKNIRQIDLDGNTVREFQAVGLGDQPRDGVIPVDVDTFHHDFVPLEDGGLLALTSELRRVDRFPVSTNRTRRGMRPANVIGDVVVEVTANGRVTKRWPLLEILDPTRISHDSFDSFWDLRGYAHVAGGTRDWSHTNAIVRDPADGGIVLSLRHQDAVVKIELETSAVRWILGDPAGWRLPHSQRLLQPTAPMEWQYHQHGVKFTPHGTLLLFSNGNRRALPPSRPVPPEKAYSRAVEYACDEDAMTVTEVWSYGGPPGDAEHFYSPFLCDADWLPETGNILITDGARLADASGKPVDAPPSDSQWARILEVTRDDPPEIVWELHIDDRQTRPELGWSVYRAERLKWPEE